MKVRMRISIAGQPMPQYGITGIFSLSPGDVLDLDDELAEKWIASGHAERTRAKAGSARESE